MIVRESLQSAARTLGGARIEDPFIEAELLLGDVLRMSRTQLRSNHLRPLNDEETSHLRALIQRRLNHEPSPYILGRREFYALDFYVDRRVLIPRPETELLVEQAIECATGLAGPHHTVSIADVGTGCGCIAVSLALALPNARVYATDISAAALEVARLNIAHHRVEHRIDLLEGDLLAPLPEPVNMVVANLPYVSSCQLGHLSPEITQFEPPVALDGGPDGMDKIGRILRQLPSRLPNQASSALS